MYFSHFRVLYPVALLLIVCSARSEGEGPYSIDSASLPGSVMGEHLDDAKMREAPADIPGGSSVALGSGEELYEDDDLEDWLMTEDSEEELQLDDSQLDGDLEDWLTVSDDEKELGDSRLDEDMEDWSMTEDSEEIFELLPSDAQSLENASGISSANILEQYRKIVNNVDFPNFSTNGGQIFSFCPLSDSDASDVLSSLSKGDTVEEVLKKFCESKAAGEEESVVDNNCGSDPSFEMSIAALSAIRNGADEAKILDQFGIAFDHDLLSILSEGRLPLVDPYKFATNLLMSLSDSMYSEKPGVLSRLWGWLSGFFYGGSDGSKEFYRVARALCPDLLDNTLNIIKQAGLSKALNKIASSDSASPNSLGRDCALAIELMSDMCDAVDCGLDNAAISALLKECGLDKLDSLSRDKLRTFYSSVCFAAVNLVTNNYLNDHKDVRDLAASSAGDGSLRLYLEALLRTGLVQSSVQQVDSSAPSCGISLSSDTESIVTMYREVCSVIKSALERGVSADKLFNEISANAFNSDLIRLTDNTMPEISKLVEALGPEEGETGASDELDNWDDELDDWDNADDDWDNLGDDWDNADDSQEGIIYA